MRSTQSAGIATVTPQMRPLSPGAGGIAGSAPVRTAVSFSLPPGLPEFWVFGAGGDRLVLTLIRHAGVGGERWMREKARQLGAAAE